MRKTLRTGLLLGLAAGGVLACPVVASAEYLVPPDNSAATQYTETVPTAGGQRNAEKDQGRKGGSPSDVLGSDKARRLGEHGQEGREVAEFTAETAPAAESEGAAAGGGEDADGGGDEPGGSADQDDRREEGSAGNGAGKGGGPRGTPRVDLEDAASSSGFGEVAGQATGFSSSQGLLLLAVLGSIAWALAYLWRRRDRSMA